MALNNLAKVFTELVSLDFCGIAVTNRLFYTPQRKYDEAKPLNEESLRILRKALGKNDPRVAMALNNLGHLLVQMVRLSA